MEFPAGALTNVLTFNGFSNISWRILYKDDASLQSPGVGGSPSANGSIFNLSQSRDSELKLRNRGCLVAHLPNCFGLLIFSTDPDFNVIQPLYRAESSNSNSVIAVGDTLLHSSPTASITSIDLAKHLVTDPQSRIPVVTDSQDKSSDPNAFSNICLTYSVFYEAFISAVTGALSLDLVQRHNLTPLGSRTFFATFHGNGYGNESMNSCGSVLATLDIEMTLAGKLVVALRTLPQNGLERLVSDHNHQPKLGTIGSLSNVDLWLAPNGIIARFVSEDGENFASVSPALSGLSNIADEGLRQTNEGSRKEWKRSVSEWLEGFGISRREPDEEVWVEVEVVSAFDTNSSYNGSRQSGGIEVPPHALRRILWPSRLCFKRAKSPFPSPINNLWCFLTSDDEPLEFAERWLAGAELRNKSLEDKGAGEVAEFQQQQQSKPSNSSPRKPDVPEVLESLARTVNYPDLQSANSVYPTPPDGALLHGLGVAPSSDGFGAAASDGAYFALSQMQNEILSGKNSRMSSASYPKDPDLLMGGLDTAPSEYAIGSGLYDTGADDEDLFGGMDEGNFGSKGITEADFSFFDEPDFGDMEEGMDMGNPGQYPQQSGFGNTEPVPELSQTPRLETKPMDYSDSRGSGRITSEPALKGNIATEDPPTSSVSPNVNRLEPIDTTEIQNDDTSDYNQRQTLSPPLSPVEIKRILFSETQQQSQPPQKGDNGLSNAARKRSHYDPIPFQQKLSYADLKYGAAGRFWFSSKGVDSKGDVRSRAGALDIPTVGIPERGRKPTKSLPGYTPHTIPDIVIPDANGEAGLYPSSEATDGSDDSSDILSERGISPAFLSGSKRKRVASNIDDSASSLEKLSIANELDISGRNSTEENSIFLGNFLSDFLDWTLAGYFSTRECNISPTLVRREDQIQIAQLMVDQVTQSSLSHKLDGFSQTPEFNEPCYSLHDLIHGGDALGQAFRLTIADMVTAPRTTKNSDPKQSVQQKQLNSFQRHDIQGSISKLSPPHIRIRRGNAFIEVLAPAIAFWETFGLEPAKGKKNVISYCIHPHSAADGADAFLERMRLAYSSCNLGTHSRGASTKTFDDGLVSWDVDSSEDISYQVVMKAIKNICEDLGSTLSKIPPSDNNIVVYIINPFTHAVALADICSSFLSLFQKYIGDADRKQVRQLHELVLQIVPMDFVSSPESIVVPAQVEYLHLALEVYNRCPPQNSPCDLMGSASALALAKSPPKAIDFKLISDQPSPLQESRCLHVAYSRSVDQRWVTAAWTDRTGSFQMTMSYCLRNKGSNISRPVSSVRQEIWETTRDIMEKSQTRWKVLLVRDEPIDMEEVEAWTSLANHHNQARPTKAELIILSTNTNPGLILELPSQLPGCAFNNLHASTYTTTPIATPSPDHMGGGLGTPGTSGATNATTPAEQPSESEADTTLIDASDETWGAILSRRLNNSNSLLEYRPALASGYLLRRNGISDNDGVVAMSVNLIHAQHSGQQGLSCETLLKDVLQMYRDLSTLARVKGLSHVKHNTLPWHIASAIKGQETMSYVL